MKNYRKILYAIIAVALVAMAMVYFLFDPASTRLFPKCAFLSLTGLKCPGCGSQRAVHALLHADVGAAFRYNALLVASLPILAMLITSRLWRKRLPRLYAMLNSTTFIAATATTIVLWWIIRNILNW